MAFQQIIERLSNVTNLDWDTFTYAGWMRINNEVQKLAILIPHEMDTKISAKNNDLGVFVKRIIEYISSNIKSIDIEALQNQLDIIENVATQPSNIVMLDGLSACGYVTFICGRDASI